MANSAPFEVISVPANIYVAEPETPFPTLDQQPGVGWNLVGTNGADNYDETTGVVLEFPYSVQRWRPVGSLAPRKVFPTEEGLILRVKLVDFTLESLSYAFNNNQVSDTPAGSGTVGFKKLAFRRGTSINTKALLIRLDASPYIEPGISQICIPLAMQIGSPQLPLALRGTPAGYDLAWEALYDPSQADGMGLGWIEAQDEEAGT